MEEKIDILPEEIEEIDCLELSDIQHITSDNIFLVLVEPKKLATQDMLEYFNDTLNPENVKKSIYNEIASRSPQEQALILEEINKIGEEEYIRMTQNMLFEEICDAKDKREMVFSNYYAFLAKVNGKIYDFALAKYFNENEYYINYAVPFSEIFEDDDWHFEYFEESKMMLLGLSDKAVELLEHFWQDYFEIIDKDAKSKILSSK